ncbi:MAG: hypothetical protein JNJ57_13495, partial [Saprospiraceae bacterium]|nr:hypothetical protein [Saprospiraceae bacterium]
LKTTLSLLLVLFFKQAYTQTIDYRKVCLRVDSFQQAANAFRKDKKWDDALATLVHYEAFIRNTVGPTDSLMAEYWNDYGVLLIDMKDYAKSDSFLRNAIRILELTGDSITCR